MFLCLKVKNPEKRIDRRTRSNNSGSQKGRNKLNKTLRIKKHGTNKKGKELDVKEKIGEISKNLESDSNGKVTNVKSIWLKKVFHFTCKELVDVAVYFENREFYCATSENVL